MKRLKYDGIDNQYIIDNFKIIEDYINVGVFDRSKFEHFEISFATAVTNHKYPHGFKFKPRDIIETYRTGAGILAWNYDKFDNKYLDITTTGAVTVRCFIGSYEERSNA